MPTDTTGQNATAATDTLEQLISGGITIHLLDTALDYNDGDTELGGKSVNSQSVADTNLTVTDAGSFAGTSTIEVDADVEFDVSANSETVVEVALQNDANANRIVLANEVNDPDLNELDTYTVETGTTIYEFGNA